MGVRGLNSYILEDGDLYFKPFELSDSYLVIDGNSIASQLYIKVLASKNKSQFGGDYDEYNKVVENFFLNLVKCNVVPIVLMDGGYERKKLRTVLQRNKERVEALKLFKFGTWNIKLFPIFLYQTFIDVMSDMKIICFNCYFEADAEIASVANALNCPVLSLDSDFYIFDILYIPFNTLNLEPVKVKLSKKEAKYHLKCSVFDRNKFLEIKHIDKKLLPILVTLLGNDYVDDAMFKLFFCHVIIPKNKKSLKQRRIHGILEWLKSENYDSAIKGILLHLKNNDAQKILKAIKTSIKAYTLGSVSGPIYECIKILLYNEKSNLDCLRVRKLKMSWPLKIDVLYHSCKLPSTTMDFIMQKIYFTFIQIEDVSRESTHFLSLKLIKAISEILSQYQARKSRRLKLYAIHSESYQKIELKEEDCPKKLENMNFINILNASTEERQKVFFDILEFQDENIETISKFDGNWSVFLASCIYWIKANKNCNLFCHLHALLLMAISNQIVQKRIGYYKTYFAFKSKYSSFLDKNKNTAVESNSDAKDFKGLLCNITRYECALIQNSLMILREMKKLDRANKNFFLSLIHTFNSFQSCLYHIMFVNTLLNYPFPHLNICDFYSGTLLFNLYMQITHNPNSFGKDMLKSAPNIEKVYNYLCDELCKYSEMAEIPLTKKNKRRKNKKKKKKKSSIEYEVIEYHSDSDNFEDTVNQYSILR